MKKGQKLYEKAKKLIPGGTQLLSKRPEMHLPGLWPSYYSKAKGVEVWDLDGNKFIDMSFMGIGACVLGYSDQDVNEAVKAAVDRSAATTLNCPEEVELAEKLINLHPWSDMARFTCSGGEAIAVAIRIARAKTGKEKVLFCGYHGWSDWYLAANIGDEKALDGQHLSGLDPSGVPRSLKETAIPFAYNDIEKFIELIAKYEGDIAAVIMEPIRGFVPKKNFHETIRKVTRKYGIILILDEVSLGFRLTSGGAHLVMGIEPDMATFAKALGNGFPIGAVIGKKQFMDVAQDSFISSTNWTNNVGFSAALATINKFEKKNVSAHLSALGGRVQEGWKKLAEKHGLKIHVSGTLPIGHFGFEASQPLVLKTLFTQLMLAEGFLATTAFYASYAHQLSHVKSYLEAADRSFAQIAIAAKSDKPEKYLKGEICHAGFQRLA